VLAPRPADASIWVNQFIKAMRNQEGEMVRNAHLQGFFRRICRFRLRPASIRDLVLVCFLLGSKAR